MSRPPLRNRTAVADLRIAIVSAVHDVCLLRGEPPGHDLELTQVIFTTMSFSQQREMLEHFRSERAELLRAGQPEATP